MKKIAFIIGLVFAGLVSNSCERDITSLNQDPKHPESLSSATLVISAQQTMLSHFLTANVNTNISRMFTQQFAQTTYVDESNYDMITRPIPRNHYNIIMSTSSASSNSPGILSAFRDASKNLINELDSDSQVKANKSAMIELMSVFSWANLVDTYGNIPYAEAMQMQEPAIFEPKYDDAKSIYSILLNRLDSAIASITVSKMGYTEDIIYGGNMEKWKKMGNSLKLRLAIHLADTDLVKAKAAAEEAFASGLFTSNDDNFGLKTFPTGQFSNPVYQEVIQSGRNDYVPSSVVVDFMNNNSDPRREKWFSLAPDGTYKGGTYGSTNAFGNFSHLTSVNNPGSFLIVGEQAQGYLLDYAEVSFIRAEAAQRGFSVGATAAVIYEEAIKASMDEYGVSAANATAYITANPYNATNWKKSIGEQAWIAMFNKGYQAWNFSRRLDYPVFVNPVNSTVESVPVRMRYSDQEFVLNQTNVKAAAVAIGGDKVSTKIFWDKF